jgi:hypothetical protein
LAIISEILLSFSSTSIKIKIDFDSHLNFFSFFLYLSLDVINWISALIKKWTLSANKNLWFEFWLIWIQNYEIPLKLKISFKIYNRPNNTYAAHALRSAMIYQSLTKIFSYQCFRSRIKYLKLNKKHWMKRFEKENNILYQKLRDV